MCVIKTIFSKKHYAIRPTKFDNKVVSVLKFNELNAPQIRFFVFFEDIPSVNLLKLFSEKFRFLKIILFCKFPNIKIYNFDWWPKTSPIIFFCLVSIYWVVLEWQTYRSATGIPVFKCFDLLCRAKMITDNLSHWPQARNFNLFTVRLGLK